jgi:hypothetical protein
MLLGEVTARIFYYLKNKCKSSNLKEKYSLSSFFGKAEQTASLVVAPLTAVYLWVKFNLFNDIHVTEKILFIF